MAGRKPEIETEEFLRQFALSPDPVLGASELASKFDMTTQGITYRLEQMEQDGLVNSKVVSRDRVWWITEDGKKRLSESTND